MEYVTIDDMYEAYYNCRKNKRRKVSSLEFEMHYETELRRLYEELNSMTYEISTSVVFGVTRPKHREVFAANFRDRVVHHLLMLRLEPILEGEMIDNSYNCRKGKGVYYGVDTLASQIRKVSKNYTRKAYILQCDLQGFFMSIDKTLLCDMVENIMRRKWRYGNTGWWIWLARKIIMHRPEMNCEVHGDKGILDNLPDNKTLFRSSGKGLPIGNLTSQIFGNYYMIPFDRRILGTLNGNGEYGRYVDDFYIVSTDKRMLLAMLPKIRRYVSEMLHLTLHPRKVNIVEVRKGVPFIGSVIKPWGIYISNRTVEHAFDVATSESVEDYARHVQRLNSYYGFMRHRLTYAIRWRIFNSIPPNIKKKLICVNMLKYELRRKVSCAREKVQH